MKFRKDDLIGIRKARFASFVLLAVCCAAVFVILSLTDGSPAAYIAVSTVAVLLVICWWFVFRRLLFDEAAFFDTFTTELRALHYRLRILESAVRQIFDGVVIVADDGDFVFVNESAKSLLAAFEADLDGVRYDEYASGFSEKLERAQILAAAREGRLAETVSIGGQTYKIGYVSLAGEHGGGRGAVAVISDVTESTKTERMQSDFVANVSHELKTPLASVKGYAETLMADMAGDPEITREFLGIIVSEADRMDRLVRELMYLVRVGAVSEGAEPEEGDLPALVKMSMKKVDKLAEAKALSLNRMFAEELRISVEMNRDRIEQVILNILGNAINYTEEKGRVDVDIISGQNCVQILISDNGIGIPEKDLPRVFERFFRVDKSRSGKTGGTGLGLAISKQIIDAHGGTIGIESKLGRGTTVTVTLPTRPLRGDAGIL